MVEYVVDLDLHLRIGHGVVLGAGEGFLPRLLALIVVGHVLTSEYPGFSLLWTGTEAVRLGTHMDIADGVQRVRP